MGAVRLLSLCAAVLYLIVLVLGIIACSTTHWLHWFQPQSAVRPLSSFPTAANYGLQQPQLQYLTDALNYATQNNQNLANIQYQEVESNHIGLWRVCFDSSVQLSLANGAATSTVFPPAILGASGDRSAPSTSGCRGYRSSSDTAGCQVRVRDGVRTTRAFVVMGIIFSGFALIASVAFAAMHQKTALFVGMLCVAFFTFACWIIAISVWPGAMNGGFCTSNFSYRGIPVLLGRANRMQYDYSYWIAIVCPILAFINLLLLVVICALPKDKEAEVAPPRPLPARPRKTSVDLDGIRLDEMYYPQVQSVMQPPPIVLPPPSVAMPMPMPMMPMAGPAMYPQLQSVPMQYLQQEAPPLQLLVPGHGYTYA